MIMLSIPLLFYYLYLGSMFSSLVMASGFLVLITDPTFSTVISYGTLYIILRFLSLC